MDSGRRAGPIILKFKAATAEPAIEVEDDGSEEEEDDEFDGFGYGIDSGFNKKKMVASAHVTPPCCQVDKCSADLTLAKKYHRRHRICELHSKAPVVVVAGLRRRFCQQCTRFHELSEFNEGRRSCRSSLAGHNKRRRKSSSEF